MVKMLGSRVLCKQIKKELAPGEIQIIGGSEEKLFIVEGIGPDVTLVTDGQTVMLPAYTTELELDKEIYHMVAENEILAVIGEV